MAKAAALERNAALMRGEKKFFLFMNAQSIEKSNGGQIQEV